MRSILPRTGSYELIYPENFKALYAIWGGIQVNWLRRILDEFLTFNNGNMRTIYFGEYIMRFLLNVGTPQPESETSSVGVINIRTISLMKLPSAPPTFTSYEEWRQQHQRQSGGPTIQERTSHPEENDEIRLAQSASLRESVEILSRNQQILGSRLKKVDKKLDKVKGFFSILWDAISCSSSISASSIAHGKRPEPRFTWSTSEEHTSSDTSGIGSSAHGTSRPGKEHVQEEDE